MEMSGRKLETTNSSGGTGADRRFFEMPGSDGNVGGSPRATSRR
jgi:hypothetical protein